MIERAKLEREVASFEQLNFDCQLAVLERLSSLGPNGAFAIPTLATALRTSNVSADDDFVAAIFQVARSMGSAGKPLAPVIVDAASYGSRQLADRDRFESTRLRAFAMATLADMKCSDMCSAMALDVVINVDDHSSPLELGAAVRTLATSELAGPDLGPVLANLLLLESSTEEFSLVRYEPRFTADQATTVQLETLDALGRIDALKNPRVLSKVRELAKASAARREDSRAVALAQKLIDDYPAGPKKMRTR